MRPQVERHLRLFDQGHTRQIGQLEGQEGVAQTQAVVGRAHKSHRKRL